MAGQSLVGLAISRAFETVVVALDGALDEETTACLRPLILDLVVGQGNLHVEVDLRRTWVDDAAVGLLAETSDHSRRRGGLFVVRGAPPVVRELLAGLGVAVADREEQDDSVIAGSRTRVPVSG